MLVLGQNPRSHPSICLFVDDVAIQCTVAKIRSKVERKHTFARIQTFPDPAGLTPALQCTKT